MTISNKKLACGAEHKPVPETTATARLPAVRERARKSPIDSKSLIILSLKYTSAAYRDVGMRDNIIDSSKGVNAMSQRKEISYSGYLELDKILAGAAAAIQRP